MVVGCEDAGLPHPVLDISIRPHYRHPNQLARLTFSGEDSQVRE